MTISREQSQCIKGLAILIIMIHNFVDHLLDISCNEMSYSQEATDAFISHVFTSSSLWYIFSYAGWVGVALFFFLSGYGLTKKYGTSGIAVLPYLKHHVVKLWMLLIPVYFLYVMISHFCFGQQYWVNQILTVSTFTANIHNIYFIEPGVYWFFGVILQFYFLFLVFRKLSDKWLYLILILFLIAYYIALYTLDEFPMMVFRHNSSGWGVPFILGIIAARKDFTIPKRWELPICVISFVALYFCMTVKPLIPLTEITAIAFFVSVARFITFRPIAFFGMISASIFVVHPFVRMLFYKTICPPHGLSSHPLTMTILYFLTAVLLSWGHHILLNKRSKRKKKATA